MCFLGNFPFFIHDLYGHSCHRNGHRILFSSQIGDVIMNATIKSFGTSAMDGRWSRTFKELAMSRHVSVNEFARQYNLSTKTVRRRIRDGSLKAVQWGGPGTSLRIPLPLESETLPPVSNTVPLSTASTPTPRRCKAHWNRPNNL